jgi:hypothetical protein
MPGVTGIWKFKKRGVQPSTVQAYQCPLDAIPFQIAQVTRRMPFHAPLVEVDRVIMHQV